MRIFDKKKGPSNEEKLKLLTRYSLEAICDRIAEKIPPEGSFESVALQFEIPGTPDLAQIDVVHHADTPDQERILLLRVCRISADLQYTRILKVGTNEELRDYLKKEGIVEEVERGMKEMRDKMQRRIDYE